MGIVRVSRSTSAADVNQASNTIENRHDLIGVGCQSIARPRGLLYLSQVVFRDIGLDPQLVEVDDAKELSLFVNQLA